MADIVLSRIVSESLCVFFPFSHNAVMIMVYLSFAAVFLVVYKCKLQSHIRCALDGFSGGNDVDSICRKMEEGFEGSNLCPAFAGISIGKTTVYKFEEFENAVFEADKAMYDVKFNKNKRCNV